jgi:hypothetical protein
LRSPAGIGLAGRSGTARIGDLAGTEPVTPGEEAAGCIMTTSRRIRASCGQLLIGPDQLFVSDSFGETLNRAPFPDPAENFPDTPI